MSKGKLKHNHSESVNTMYQVSPSVNIYHQALSFNNAARELNKPDNSMQVPSLVCISFSIELYLKCLQAERRYKYKNELIDGGTSYNDIFDVTLLKGGHDLVKLFNSLPDPIKDKINTFYKSANLSVVHPKIIDALDLVKDVFVDLRYEYEKNTSCVAESTLYKLADFFRHFVETQLKEKQISGGHEIFYPFEKM